MKLLALFTLVAVVPLGHALPSEHRGDISADYSRFAQSGHFSVDEAVAGMYTADIDTSTDSPGRRSRYSRRSDISRPGEGRPYVPNEPPPSPPARDPQPAYVPPPANTPPRV